ncbi:GGDEF domain-containing protein, partial [Arcobacter sp.]|uniref:GGDEF domain-containing protein n=1 Tax=Arcobacter sp. TaxID=1872629 RepID=UPI003D139D8E
GDIIGFTSVRQDISDKKRIYELSITDGLTSLFNRRYFNEIAQTMIDNNSRNNEIFAFLILDIDNFKKYNDTYGHQEGDSVLISVANSLKNTFKRSDDYIFRLGGEEFGVLISAKELCDVMPLVDAARENIENLNIPHEKNPPKNVLTASFGLTILKSKKESFNLDDIYKITDD